MRTLGDQPQKPLVGQDCILRPIFNRPAGMEFSAAGEWDASSTKS
jgi:hypothetical protein